MCIMGNKSFRFKQFDVFHDKCAMKVGTDGVLLGAWTDLNGCASVLDIGTGTGLVALMAAQRNIRAEITGIEIDEDAAMQAGENARNSKFANRIAIMRTSFQDFAASTSEKFDAIVSNPPYFTDSLQSPDHARTQARHDGSLTVFELLDKSRNIVSDSGALSLIYPSDGFKQVEMAISDFGWHIRRRTDVFATINSNRPKRVLLELKPSNPSQDPVCSFLRIEKERNVYTDEYVELTKEFYLKM